MLISKAICIENIVRGWNKATIYFISSLAISNCKYVSKYLLFYYIKEAYNSVENCLQFPSIFEGKPRQYAALLRWNRGCFATAHIHTVLHRSWKKKPLYVSSFVTAFRREVKVLINWNQCTWQKMECQSENKTIW